MYREIFGVLYLIICVKTENVCKEKFYYADGKCLYFSIKPALWSEAKEHCAKLDAKLANFR